MKSILLIFVVISIVVVGSARHIQFDVVSSGDDAELNIDTTEKIADIHDTSIEEVRNIKASRFVPINNIIFFKKHPPCEKDGFQRDLFGICREVW